MKAYIVADITIHDAETYERYKGMVPASIARYGGKHLVRGATTTRLEGTCDPRRLVIL